MRRFLPHILLCLAIVCSCTPEESKPLPSSKDGADLSLRINLSDFSMATPDAATRSVADYQGTLDKLYSDEINSFAIGVFKLNMGDLGQSRLIGYRLFIEDDQIDSQKYFFRNVDNYTYHVDPNMLLPDITLESTGGIYADGEDDTTDADSPYGYNGFVKDALGKNTAVQVNFLHEHPLHGDLESLHADHYFIFAIANFHQCPALIDGHTVALWIKESVAYWQRHCQEPDFDGVVYYPIDDEDAFEGKFQGCEHLIYGRMLLADASVTYNAGAFDPVTGTYEHHHNDTIVSPSYMRNPRTAAMSTFIEQCSLSNGINIHSHQLKRIASRVTFYIDNNGSYPVQIKKFSLSDNFSAAALYVIPDTENLINTRYTSPSWKGAPVVTHSKALVSFDSTVVYHTYGGAQVFFDALTLEGRDPENPYSFDIKVSVEGIGKYYFDIDSSIRSYSDFITDLADDVNWPVGESRSYLLRNTRTEIINHSGIQHFVRSYGANRPMGEVSGEGGNSGEWARVVGNINTPTQELAYIWDFEKVSSTSIRIRNRATHTYFKIQGSSTTGDQLILTNNADEATAFTPIQQSLGVSAGSMIFSSTYNGTQVALHMLNQANNGRQVVSLSRWINDAGSYFVIYPVEGTNNVIPGTEVTINKELHVPIQAISMHNGLPYPLHEMHRNDHLQVLINVSYNDKIQDIQFEALDWGKSDNIINFD